MQRTSNEFRCRASCFEFAATGFVPQLMKVQIDFVQPRESA